MWSARRGQQALAPCCLGIHRVRKIKIKQGHFIEDTAGFAGGSDAGGQVGGKARNTEAYTSPEGVYDSKQKITPPKDWARWGKMRPGRQSPEPTI